MDAMGMMRDLDQIRERDDSRESTKLVVLALGGLAAACVLFAVGVMIGRDGDAARPARREDPLARLDALAGQVAAQTPPPVTYPSRLVDSPVLPGAAPATTAPGEPAIVPARPAATVPETSARAAAVPAAALLEPGGRVRETPPAVAQLPVAPANHARIAPAPPLAGPAPAGSDGAFTLQVSSFRTLASAQVFAQRLRERGHRAFVTSGASGTSGATWHRVRIGPFASLREAQRYRADFEGRERLPTFVVRRDDPNQH
jgi:cell division septation protein DedD